MTIVRGQARSTYLPKDHAFSSAYLALISGIAPTPSKFPFRLSWAAPQILIEWDVELKEGQVYQARWQKGMPVTYWIVRNSKMVEISREDAIDLVANPNYTTLGA